MGRITIFSITGCPFCIKSKEALKARNIPYLEINLSLYPDKRTDMLALSDSLTVPQIFFNETHIGGSPKLCALLEQWDKDSALNLHGSPKQRYEKEVKAKPDPSDKRLQPSTKDPTKDPVAPIRGELDKIKLPPKSQGFVTYLEMMSRLMKSTPTSDLSYHGKAYTNSITGQDFLLYLMTEFTLTKQEAFKFGSYLYDRKMITHVTGDHAFTDRNDLYFRLQPHQTPKILNSYRIWTDRVDPNSLGVVTRLSKLMQGIFDDATESDGNINLLSVSNNTKYTQFEEEVCELQKINMLHMDVNTKTAFAINVYNLLIKYAQVKIGVPDGNIQRASFFTRVTMNIGGEIFSFHELENGILRANAVPPLSINKTFSLNDKRLKLALQKVDPRIHFGLNCGARSCPPVKKFTATDLNEELRIVALAFCEDDANVLINEASKSVHLNMIFKWYLKDFATTVNELPKILLQFTKGDKKQLLEKMLKKKGIKIEFNVYDWSSNVKEGRDVGSYGLKADRVTVKSIFDAFCL